MDFLKLSDGDMGQDIENKDLEMWAPTAESLAQDVLSSQKKHECERRVTVKGLQRNVTVVMEGPQGPPGRIIGRQKSRQTDRMPFPTRGLVHSALTAGSLLS